MRIAYVVDDFTRSHGASDAAGPDKPVTIERLAPDVEELLDRLGVRHAHVSGSSAGGAKGVDGLLAMDREGYERLKNIPNHRWVVYEGLVHNITNGVPERCATELLRFLQET